MVAAGRLTATIAGSIKKAQQENVFFEELYNDPAAATGKNEFLFFIKPEITLPADSIQLENILDLVQEKIERFGLTIHNVKVLSAKYLEQYNIIAQHYGVINKIASNAAASLSEGAKEKFTQLYGKTINDVKLLGGVEFLEQYPAFNAYSLDFLWQNVENKKLAGGTYAEVIKVDNEQLYVINGFHPRQLKQFTEKGRSIVVMTLSGDLNWNEARGNFIGATNPQAAAAGSLRNTFLNRKDELGLAEISQGVNGVHLSAGPVEALVELRRYNTNFADAAQTKTWTDFSFGKQLAANFTPEQIEKIVNNENVTVEGKSVSIFDLTEEKNAEEAITLLKAHL